eukprot:TRINITY_DN4292_c0_g2_i2.p1 TRINITY_DN4292_c0_g2~~TRINITY_DN4292_c0_g2_i2.p1  ORF type:complete len:430 (+),score=106.55 TRINITY_DN4292_c0_g2_i2:888-2177(+)
MMTVLAQASQVHRDDMEAVTRFSGQPIHEIARLQFKDKKLWFDQQLLRIRPPHQGGSTEIHLRRAELTNDSWNQVSALTVQQMRSDWTFQFAGETNTGDDAGGITKEWFEIMTKEVFNEGIGLFKFTEAHNLAYQINEYSDCNQPQHLVWFKFTGRMMAKALLEGLPLKAHLAPTLYKHMLQVPIRLEDLKGVDTEQYNSMVYMKDNSVTDIFFETFSATTNNEIYGERVCDLKENGRNIEVTDENKNEYMSLYLEWRVYGNRKEQIKAFLGGFWEVIPVEFVKVFDWQQLELVMCGMPDVDVKDWKANTEFMGEYHAKHKVIQMFFKVVQSMEQEERSKLLQFVTSSSVVPVGGFSLLQGGQGEPCKFTIDAVPYTGKKINGRWSNQLPKAHTCFNKLHLPIYPDKEVLHSSIAIALVTESEGFTMEE